MERQVSDLQSKLYHHEHNTLFIDFRSQWQYVRLLEQHDERIE
jgi:hypothetical protein